MSTDELSAHDALYVETELHGEKCLFTSSRIRSDTVPRPLRKYEVRYADERDPIMVRPNVDDGFMGTLITQHRVDMAICDEVALDEGEVDFFDGPVMGMADFARKLGIEAEPGRTPDKAGRAEPTSGLSGDAACGYRRSRDGSQLMRDGESQPYEKVLETDEHLYYQNEDGTVMLWKDGEEIGLASDNYFAEVGLNDSLEAIWTRTGGGRALFIGSDAREYLPEIAADFGWSIPYEDAGRIACHDIEVYGLRALFTEKSVLEGSVPRSLHRYELESEPGRATGTVKLSKNVRLNFAGTLITERPLDLGSDGEIRLDPKDVSLRSDAPVKLKDFARECGLRIKPPKDRER